MENTAFVRSKKEKGCAQIPSANFNFLVDKSMRTISTEIGKETNRTTDLLELLR